MNESKSLKKKKKGCCNPSGVFNINKLYKKQFKYIKVEVEMPPEPMDIQWENIGYTLPTKLWLTFKLITFFLYCMIFGVIIMILYAQKEMIEDDMKDRHPDDKAKGPSTLAQTLALILSIAISSSNGTLTAIFRLITKAEKHETHTGYNYYLARRVAFGQFSNSVLVFSIATIFLNLNKVEGTP